MKNIMFRISRVAIAGLFVSFGALTLPSALAIEIEPGMWQDTATSSVNGKPGKPEVTSDCITPQDARNPVKALAGMKDASASQCQTLNVKESGNVVSFVMRCGDPKQGSIDMDAAFTFENARHYTGALTSVMSIMGQKTTTVMTVDSKWIGACKK